MGNEHLGIILDSPYTLKTTREAAAALGLQCAIVLSSLHSWIAFRDRYANDNAETHDGRLWRAMSYYDLSQKTLFTVVTIRRQIVRLEELGIVLSTQEYNKFPVDRTKSYAIDYDEFWRFMEVWEEHGSPLFNGGHSPVEYYEFLQAFVDGEPRPGRQ